MCFYTDFTLLKILIIRFFFTSISLYNDYEHNTNYNNREVDEIDQFIYFYSPTIKFKFKTKYYYITYFASCLKKKNSYKQCEKT